MNKTKSSKKHGKKNVKFDNAVSKTYTTTSAGIGETWMNIKSLLDNGCFVDVILITGRVRIKAHKVILAASSGYFTAMFTSPMRESSQYEIVMKDVDPWAMETIVKYIYTGVINIDDNGVRVLLETAGLLCMSELEAFCVDFLIEKLSLSTIFRIREFAESMQCAPLLAASRLFMLNNFMEIIKEEDFALLPFKEVADLLSNNELNVASEEIAFHGLMLWLEYSLRERSVHAGQLLSHIRVPFLSRQFIVENIENEPLFYEIPQAQTIVAEAFEYQLVPELRHEVRSERTTGRPSVVGEICAVGRIDGSDPTIKIEVYDASTNRWQVATTLTKDRLQFGVCEWNNELCFLGGHTGPTILQTVETYNVRTGNRTTLPSMKIPRYGMGVGVINQMMYVAGGHDGRNYINSVEVLDTWAEEFRPISPMLANKFRAGVAVLGDKLYVIGGINDNGRSATVEIYDPFSDRWSVGPHLTVARNAVGIAVLNNAIYAVGGVAATVNASMERLDPRIGKGWQSMAPMKNGGRARLGVCAKEGWLYAAGGYNSAGAFLRHTEVYYPAMNRWESLADLEQVCASNILNVRFPRL